ncbi:MAG TPA: SRPBCC family protein [Gemmatimonadaceae bacterium]|jgi:uncharacterized protein YndB with AHSA1/START domain
MKWIAIIIGVIVLLAMAVYAFGATLPVQHTASRSANFASPPEAIWAVITDPGRFTSWRKDLDSVEVLTPRNGHPTWREFSRGQRITFEITESEMPRRLVGTITDRGLPFGGSWEYVIAPAGSGSRVTITEHGEVYNPIFRFVSRYVMGQTKTLDSYLTALAAKLGDRYTPTD